MSLYKQEILNKLKDPMFFINKVLGVKLWSKQREIVESVWRNKRTTVKACHGIGKCRWVEDSIILSDGSVETMGEMLKRKKAYIKSFNDDGEQIDTIALFSNNGEKECVRITTDNGYTITTTLNHPLMVADFDKTRPVLCNGRRSQITNIRWKDAKDLNVGQPIKMTNKINITNAKEISDDIVKIFGYLCGNGGTTQNIVFTTSCDKHLDEMKFLTEKNFNVRCKHIENYDYAFTKEIRSNDKNELMELCREFGIYGCKSKDKRIPKQIFNLSERQIALFLSRLFSCDGYIVKKGHRSTYYFGITLASLGMIEDIKWLLLRLGITCWFRYKKSKCGGKSFDAWEVIVNKSRDLKLLFEKVDVKFGQEEKMELAKESFKKFDDNKTQKWQKDFCEEWACWDRIKSIEFVGKLPTVAIEVPETSVYLTQFVEHNTKVAGNILLAFLYGYKPSIVISTAPTWRQVEKLLWKEVRSSYNKARLNLGGFISPKSPELQILQDEWYAAGISTDKPDKFQGFHEKNILVIVDEAAGVEPKIFEGIEGILTSENAHLLLIGNPTSTAGEFYTSFKDKSYNQITVSAYDTPNFKQTGITEMDIASGDWVEKNNIIVKKNGGLIAPYLITPEWAADKYKRWKPNSVLYESKVKANFPNQSLDSLIPISWVEAAMERWDEVADDESNIRDMGVDVAEFGGDENIFAVRCGRKILEIVALSGMDESKIVAYMRLYFHRHQMESVKVDGVGIGHAVVTMANKAGVNALAMKGSWSPYDEDDSEDMADMFYNLRAQMYYNLRELLNPVRTVNPYPIALPKDEMLLQELSMIKYKIGDRGKIQIERKEEFRERLGRSPDRMDAVVLAFAPKEWAKAEEEHEPNIVIFGR